MEFKTIEDKEAALNEISTDPNDAPVGVKHEDYLRETEAKIDEIMKAQIVENPEEPTDEPVGLPVEKPVERVQTDEPDMTPIEDKKDVSSDYDALKRNNDYLTQQLNASNRDNEDKLSALQQQIEDLKKSALEKKPEEKDETDTEITDVKEQIKTLEKEMNAEKDEDDFEDTEETIKKLKKQGQLQIKLDALREKKHNDILARQRAEIDDLKNKHRMVAEKEQETEKEAKRNKKIDGFRDTIPALKGEVGYAQMEAEYSKFSAEVASAYFNIPVNKVKSKDSEVAMVKYLEGSPLLIDALSSRGIKEPQDMRKFVILSEVDALRQGYVLDKLTGEFVKMTDGEGNHVNFPSLKAAYNYLQQENGDYGKNILKMQKNTADNIMHAITRKDTVELTNKEQRGENIDDMTTERATELFEKYDTDMIVLRARKNFEDPLVGEYNKALVKLGYSPLARDDI